MSETNPDLRAPEWEKDGVAMTKDGLVALRQFARPDPRDDYVVKSRDIWLCCAWNERRLQEENAKLKAALEASKIFVPDLIDQLDSLRRMHERHPSELSTGTAMAYAHAAAMLREAMK